MDTAQNPNLLVRNMNLKMKHIGEFLKWYTVDVLISAGVKWIPL